MGYRKYISSFTNYLGTQVTESFIERGLLTYMNKNWLLHFMGRIR